MNISIEKISNGFVISIGNKKTFCDVPEAVCGVLAEWALQVCENGEQEGGAQVSLKSYIDQMKIIEQEQAMIPPSGRLYDPTGKLLR